MKAIELIIDGIVIYVGYRIIKFYGGLREIHGMANCSRAVDRIVNDKELREKIYEELNDILDKERKRKENDYE